MTTFRIASMAISNLLPKTPSSSSAQQFHLSRTTTSISSRYSRFHLGAKRKITNLSVTKSQADVREEDIVIVGGGIAGLATALSFNRLGVKSLVLEQAESLRIEGSSLTLSKNAWRVLDAIGVGNQLRPQFLEIEGISMNTQDGRQLRSFRFRDEDPSHELRAVERRALLETLANQLPPDSVRFSSKLENIQTAETGKTHLQLEDGTKILAKIVIGCDGTRSKVAKWMGFSEPKYAGYCAFRGLGVYPEGQPFPPQVSYNYGRGIRAGYVPISHTKVYWFICFNSTIPGPKIQDPAVLKKEAKELVSTWRKELLDLIDVTPDETISKTPIVDRWLWPLIAPPASKGQVVLVGDAWHPMTPNIGQGACCALEDSVVLARKLARAINKRSESVQEAMRSYGNERWQRVFPLTVRANLVGGLGQWDNSVVCSVRDNFLIPKLVKPGSMTQHTNFECEPLVAEG